MRSLRTDTIMDTRLVHSPRRRRQQPKQAKLIGPRTAASAGGFSLLELMLVIAIALVLMAIALPQLGTSLTYTKWRGAMSDLSGVFQSCRSQAIKNNASQQLDFTLNNGLVVAYIDVPGSTGGLAGKNQVWMFSQFSKVPAPPTTSTNPAPLTAGTMWGGSSTTPPETTLNICFNSRGIPCTCPDTATAYCPGITRGYAFYFTQGTQWAAVGVSPAGRIKTYFWNGSAWAN